MIAGIGTDIVAIARIARAIERFLGNKTSLGAITPARAAALYEAETRRVIEAKGKPVEYMLFLDEGHGFAKPANRLKFYAAAEAFLARHLAAA